MCVYHTCLCISLSGCCTRSIYLKVSIKRLLKRNLVDESMNTLADKAQVHKQGMPHSDMHSITRPHHSTAMQPYISSSKFSAD